MDHPRKEFILRLQCLCPRCSRARPLPSCRCHRASVDHQGSVHHQWNQPVEVSAKRSSVPVSLRATKRVIRQLDLAGNEEPVGDEAVKELSEMFKHQLPKRAMQALRVVSKLANGAVTDANSCLSTNLLQIQPTVVCLQETKLQQIDTQLANEFLSPALSRFFFLPADGYCFSLEPRLDHDI